MALELVKTISGAAVRISLVDGTAFVDSNTAGLFSTMADGWHYAKFTDAEGDEAAGWLWKPGSGEETGTDLLNGWDFTSGWAPSNVAVSIDSANSFSSSDVTYSRGIYVLASILGTGDLGKLFKLALAGSTTAAPIVTCTTDSGSVFLTGFGSAYKTHSHDGAFPYLRITKDGSATITTLQFQQVTAPSSNGVLITSTKAGSIQNFTTVDGDFDYNAATYDVTIYEDRGGYSGVTLSGVSTSPTMATFTAAMRLSLVDGTAFVDSATSLLAGFRDGNYKITLTDAEGDTAIGWMSAAGSGEVLGAEKILNADFSSWAGDNPVSWDVHGETGTNYITENSGCQIVSDGSWVYMDQSLGTFTVGTLLKTTMVISAEVLGKIQYKVARCGSQLDYAQPSGVGAHSVYGTIDEGLSTSVLIGRVGVCNVTTTGMSIKQVTAPSTKGVLITSTKAGSIQNFTTVDANFDYNAASYTVTVSTE